MKKVLCWMDNPMSHTGFSNITRAVCGRLYQDGYEVHVLGITSPLPDINGKFPYRIWPAAGIKTMEGDDEGSLGFNQVQFMIKSIRPDLVIVVLDPVNLFKAFLGQHCLRDTLMQIRKGDWDHLGLKEFKVLSYPPIEGWPLGKVITLALEEAAQWGEVLLWCESAQGLVRDALPEYSFDYAYLGLDHLEEEPITRRDRDLLRLFAGIKPNDFFIGSIGVNKRTKGFPALLDVAREIKEMGEHKDIHFYLHTEAERPCMGGYLLKNIAENLGVTDFVHFKPDTNIENHGQIWTGVDRSLGTLGQVRETAQEMGLPDSLEQYAHLPGLSYNASQFAQYDFTSRVRCFDLYVDPSQVEGWGLPQGEAMRLGVPALIPDDQHVRSEVYGHAGLSMKTLPPRMWDWWDSGARLVKFDPRAVAKQIIGLKNDRVFLEEIGPKLPEKLSHLTWASCTDKVMEKVIKLIGGPND